MSRDYEEKMNSLIPMVVEQTSKGERAYDIYSRLLKERLNKIYSKHTGKYVDEISKALERDNFMTAEDAKKFGLIDSVVEKRK